MFDLVAERGVRELQRASGERPERGANGHADAEFDGQDHVQEPRDVLRRPRHLLPARSPLLPAQRRLRTRKQPNLSLSIPPRFTSRG